ncbi:MAG: BatA domain-containing protein [Planctomycetales bacterium]
MVWLHPLLLAGLLLTAIPVVLHLLLRAKPKKLVFPALRLIQNRRRTNVRRLRLRHLALLASRMVLIAALVAAVARPSVPAADYAPRWGDWLRLGLLAASLAAVYAGLLALWRRSRIAPHELAYRRTMLRAGLGVGGLLAFVLLVAWPYQQRIAAAITQPTLAPSEFLPVAAAMVFDTSLSMQYRQEGRTRLEVAQEIATRHLGSLPRTSRVAVIETSPADGPIRFQSDQSQPVKRIAALETRPLRVPLEDRLAAAIEAQLEDKQKDAAGAASPGADLLREVYVFTDLAASGWRPEETPRLAEALAQAPEVGVYLIDVGVTNPTNLALTELTLAEQTIPKGNEALLKVTLEATGMEPGERTVELHVENDAGRMMKVEQQHPQVDGKSATLVQFPVRATAGPVLQGEVRLLASDPLAFDDVRYFSLLVQPPAEVLVVAENRRDARFLIDVLSPSDLAPLGKLRYRCQYASPARLGTTDLSKYAVVCLVNVADPGSAGWTAVERFVAAGGSAFIVLGDKVKHAAWLSETAKELLPGDLTARLKFDPPEFLDLENLSHPMLRKFVDWGTAGLTAEPIREYWRVTPATRDSAVIASYTDHRRGPALVERAVGKGRVVMLTTSLDRRWNDLPVSGWSYVALADQLMQYLTRSPTNDFNYLAGETVQIALDPALPLSAFLLRKPLLQQLRSEVVPGALQVTVHDVDQLGNYRLTSADPQARFSRGFSINLEGSESHLQRLTQAELDARLGVDRYSLARDIDHLQRNVRAGRLGREAFPLLALILLAFFLGEHFLANRFYESEQPGAATPASANSPAS